MSAVADARASLRADEQIWAPIAVLAIGAFTGVANGVLLSPLLVPISRQFGVSPGRTGQLGSVFALVAMLTALLGAPHLRRWSPRRVLRFQTPVIALATLLCALAPGFGWLMAGRALAGIGGGLLLATCMATAGDLCPDPVRRGRAIGVIVSATTLAVVLGLPLFAQIEERAGWRWSIAGLLPPLVVLFVSAGVLPDRPGTATATGGYRAVLADRPSCWLLGTMALYGLVYYGWLTYFAAYLRTEFGAGADTLSLLFLVSGAVELLTNNLGPVLLRRARPARVFVATVVVWSASLLATGLLSTTVWSLFIAIAITGVCACVLYLAIYLRAVESRPELRGTVVSLVSAASGLGSAAGAATGGAVLAGGGGYVAVYRLLGLVLLATIVSFRLAAGARPHDAIEVPATRHPGGVPVRAAAGAG